jgi:pimeloyl-ACP methyl ester carboxylesterase
MGSITAAAGSLWQETLCYAFSTGLGKPGERRSGMSVLYEFCHPTRWYSKLLAAGLALAFFTLLAAGIVAAYIVYQIVAPVGAESAIDLTNFPGHPENISYSLTSGGDRTAWFFPGLTSAPVVVLCPGYQTGRGEALPLAAAIQDHGYNVVVFDIEGGANSKEPSTLGFREKDELRAVMAAISQRDDVDPSRFGLWGADLGGYVALAVAEADPRVKALTVESVYDQPQDMAGVLIDRQGVAALPLLGNFSRKGFYWLHYSERDTPPLSAGLDRLAGVSKLFLSTAQESKLAASTRDLFQFAPDPKELIELTHGSYSGLVDSEKRDYENRLVGFFLTNLPLEAPEITTPTSTPTGVPKPTSAPMPSAAVR